MKASKQHMSAPVYIAPFTHTTPHMVASDFPTVPTDSPPNCPPRCPSHKRPHLPPYPCSLQDLARLSLSDPEYLAVHSDAQQATPLKLQQAYAVVREGACGGQQKGRAVVSTGPG